MSVLYPLRFRPILRRYLWGGRRLDTLGKTLGDGNDYAESWEIADHGHDQSTVACGPLAGLTLSELVTRHGCELLGDSAGAKQFPLLFKFLDAQDRLSIQVHPDDARAARLDPPALGKTEAWVILAAEPGTYLLAGLRRGIDRDKLAHEVARRTCELCLERIEPRVGDCFFLPAGVVHALGPGLLVAEIQQTSDTTYRLYDWSRLGPDGKTRPLHIAEALDAIDYDYGPVAAARPTPTGHAGLDRLVACDKFTLNRWNFTGAELVGGDGRCHILVVLEGAATVEGDPAEGPLHRGGVLLLPAECGARKIHAAQPVTLLDIHLP